jgi:alginate O-acetyltransferase complex protein AlgI
VHFTSFSFGYFFVLTLTASVWLRAKPTPHKVLLLAASYFFYARLNLWLIALLVGSSLVNFLLGEVMVKQTNPRLRRWALWGGLLANLGLLATFKYYNFFQQTVAQAAAWLRLESHLPLLELALPLGISFFTFQGLAYVIDLYRGRGARAERLLDFLLYIAFFPKLLSGPLTRSKDFLPQLAAPAPLRMTHLSQAASLVASGLFKKAVLASVLGPRLVDDAFIAPENYSSGALAMAAFAYSIQLYCDFSGYTDMARGLALLLGYTLPENFNSPYAATDPGMFWHRWHATFSAWLRDYVYFTLGGSKGSFLNGCRNLLVTFTISGLWHGASWGYILWGFTHGVVLCVHKAIRVARRQVGWVGREPWWWLAGGWFFTFGVVVFSRVLFRAGDLQTAGAFYGRMLELSLPGQGFDGWVVAASAVGLALNFFGRRVRQGFLWAHDRTPLMLKPVLWLVVAISILALQPGDIAPYIYFQF